MASVLPCEKRFVHPDTARQDASVLRHVVHTNSNQAAVHASTERPGTIQVGDLVYLVRHEL